ncbi:CDP-glycerol glycerophosphotransferase family protein [Halosquirtibacter xylanolyticus]|uniref:CDP-glycerol glycerophosphotransferase family protein n=1 Tax=Halosquirtibacter xylanolyticus TaxID=3374599 RepID=UPI0037483AFB|nr:CDP-glycerol glycerophosphotransferase family protein [Prolixibacteraceae bacterium]
MELKAGISLWKQIKNWIQILVVRPIMWIAYMKLHIFSIKKKNRVSIFVIEGHFFDNTKSLAPVITTDRDLEVAFIVKHDRVREVMQKEGYRVMKMKSFAALRFFLRSSYVAFSYGSSFMEFFPYFISPRWQEVLFIDHGIPVKATARKVPKYQHYGNHLLLQQYTYCICSGAQEAELLAEAYAIPLQNALVTGMPRNDRLITLMEHPELITKDIKKGSKRAILYAPTWRPYGRTHFFPFADHDLERVKKWLEDHDAILYFRVHKEDLRRNEAFFSQLDMDGPFRLVNQDFEPDVVEILSQFDLLISDFSAMIADFLPLDRAMVFLPYDYDIYAAQVGVIMDYDLLTPGAVVYDEVSFLDALAEGLDHPTKYAEERHKLMDVFYQFEDNKSSLRVVAEIKRSLFRHHYQALEK